MSLRALLSWLESLLRDAQFALRMLRKNPLVTAAAVVSLALAIGACTAAFSLIDSLVLRKLPVHDPDGLVYLTYGVNQDSSSFNYPLFTQMREAAAGHAKLFAMSHQMSRRRAVLDDAQGQAEQIYGQWISGDAFSILGIRPALGRLLTPDDDRTPGQHPVAVISHDFWSRRFQRDPTVLGRWLTMEETQYQIIGVAQDGFTGVEPGVMTDVWVPMMMGRTEALNHPGWQWFRVWGRPNPEVPQEQLRTMLQTVFTNQRRERSARFAADEPRETIERYINTPLQVQSAANGPSVLRQQFERPLWILAAVVGLVLLIACSNVASLAIARATAREREMAVRMSLGAGRGRLVQQMLIESGLLSGAACLLGAAFAAWTGPAVVSRLSTWESTVRLGVQFDWRAFVFLSAVGVLTALLFGTGPAFRASGVAPGEALKSGSSKQSARIGVFRPLVAGQIAFSFIVLFVAGLFLLSFAHLKRVDVGFDPHNLVLLDVGSPDLRNAEQKARAVWQQLQDRLREVPGVQSVSLSNWGLFSGSSWTSDVRIPGRAADSFPVYFLAISPRFLETMRIRLLDGREFQPRDAEPEKPSVVIVNRAFAQRYFPGENVIGKRFYQFGEGNKPEWLEIVGLAGDAKYTDLREAVPPTVYVPLRGDESAALQVRTTLEPMALANLVREELPRVHPAFTLTDVNLQSTLVDDSILRDRLLALLSGFFGLVATVLAAVGIYGVLNYSVVQRTREIGIRIALGAQPRRVVRLIVSHIGLLAGIGLAVGLAGGIGIARFITSLLFEVKPSDGWSLLLPLAGLLLTAGVAALIPALRAARVDPMVALRYE